MVAIARFPGDNVALYMPAVQISTYGSAKASMAVDGIHDTASCTYNYDAHPWWAVYLEATYSVDHVTVTNDASTYFGKCR